jgi:hypothetical protein
MTLVSADAATAYGGSRKRSVIQTRRRATPLRALEWFRTHSELSVRYLVENVSISGASQLRSFVVGAAAGLAAVGYVRASEILMGPFIVVLMGISQVAVPRLRVCSTRSPRTSHVFCFHSRWDSGRSRHRLGAILMTVFPLGPGPARLKELWMPTAQLITSWGVTAAQAFAALVWWHQLRSALANHDAVPEVA